MTETNKFTGTENKRLFGVSCCWLYKNRWISFSFCILSLPFFRHLAIWHPFHFYFSSPLPNEMKRNRKKNNNKSNNNSEAFYRPFRGWTDASGLFVHVFKYFTYPRSEETTVNKYIIYIYILVVGSIWIYVPFNVFFKYDIILREDLITV